MWRLVLKMHGNLFYFIQSKRKWFSLELDYLLHGVHFQFKEFISYMYIHTALQGVTRHLSIVFIYLFCTWYFCAWEFPVYSLDLKNFISRLFRRGDIYIKTEQGNNDIIFLVPIIDSPILFPGKFDSLKWCYSNSRDDSNSRIASNSSIASNSRKVGNSRKVSNSRDANNMAVSQQYS